MTFLRPGPGPSCRIWSSLLCVLFLVGKTASAAPAHGELPNFDRRRERAVPKVALDRRVAADTELKQRVPKVEVTRDEVTGTPTWISTMDGFLTEPGGAGRAVKADALRAFDAQDTHRVVKAFINEHRDVFGHDSSALSNAVVKRDYVTPHNELRTVTWEQQLDGIPVFGGRLRAHLTRNEELVNVSSGFLPSLETAADARQRTAVKAKSAPQISARDAVLMASTNLQFAVAPAELRVASPAAGNEQRQKLTAPGWRRDAELALVWLPVSETSVRLCWDVWIVEPRSGDGYELLVDAGTGEVWKRRSLTFDASPATYRVFTTNNPTPLWPGYSAPSTVQPPQVARTLQTLTSINALASPQGWIPDGQNKLTGNNALTRYWRQTGPGSFTGSEVTGSVSRVFDFPLNIAVHPTNHPHAAAANTFYWVNWLHDRMYSLGFTEPAGNCQEDNFGRGGTGSDRVEIFVHDRQKEDNAGATVWAEGSSPELEFGIYTGPSPDRDSALENSTIIHEFVHVVSIRIHDQDLDFSQSRGMGEGWSDFYAASYLSDAADDPNACYPNSAYTALNMWGTPFDENYYFGNRRYPYSTDLTRNPLTFKDIDPAQQSLHTGVPSHPALFGFPGSEVHMQGEVWCALLWEARARLIAKHGFSAGNQIMLQLVFDGMRLNPPNPNFIQARNTILAADTMNNAGVNHPELWAAFAKRGLGIDATSPLTDTTAGVVESFDSLDKLLVTPGGGLTMQGPEGGPFAPTSQTFVLTNQGNTSLSWRARVDPPLQINVSSGVLAGNAQLSVNVSLNASAAAGLSEGVYNSVVRFTNQTSGAVFERTFSLFVGALYPIAETWLGYAGDTNDLAFKTLRFEPDLTGTNYSFCRPVGIVTNFPTDPAPGEALEFSDTNYVVRSLANGAQFNFYGKTYTSLAVMDDGSVVFGGQHTNPATQIYGLNGHFAVPRISAFRYFYGTWNLDEARASWRQLSNRVAITWERAKANSASNDFQMELFFDGSVTLTLLRVRTTIGTVGLSPGGGIPIVFRETNLSAGPPCDFFPLLSLSLPANVTEGSGTTTGRVSIPFPAAFNLSVSLASSDPGEISVPANVIIPLGQTSAVFSMTMPNDALVDGARIAYITATAFFHLPATESIWVGDNEIVALNISSGGTLSEGGSAVNRTVSMSAPAGDIVVVNLTSSPSNKLTVVPPVVFIPPGQTSAVFSVRATDDSRIEGNATATLTATVSNWTSSVRTFTILDNESTDLTLFTPLLVSESAGTLTNGGRVQLSGTLPTNLLVAVISDDETEVKTPALGVVIPAGQTSALFPLFIQDDAIVDGLAMARIRALASGFGPATNSLFVLDNDGAPEPYDPYPPHLSTNISVDAYLSWGRTEGEMVVNGGFETANLAGWEMSGNASGLWMPNDGSFDPRSPDAAMAPLAGNFSALAEQLGAGTHVLYQDIFIPLNATGVGLSWSDRIRNHAGEFTAQQRFAVELRDTTNNVLTTLFATSTNTPMFSAWTDRSFDLGAYRGATVRLAFVIENGLNFLNVHLDNVSLVATGAAPTTFDIYFGTNNPPAQADFLATTTATIRSLPMLAGGTDYFWQIKARRGTITNAGPVWRFRTEGSSVAGTPIAFGTTWRYRNTGQDLGTTWTNLNYNDSAWSSGVGTLGFGGSQDTTIGFATNKYVTYYFRRKFNVLNPSSIAALTARLQRDDGAIIWINGRAAIVENMDSRGPWAFDDSASSDVTGFAELTPVAFELSPSLLVAGTNIVAIEVHQFVPRPPAFSDDLYFDLELKTVTNTGNEAPSVTLTNPAGFTFLLPTNVILNAAVEDEVIVGTDVEYFVDGVSVGVATFPPYTLVWTNPPLGAHTIVAVATDSPGLSGTSAPIHVVVAPATGTMTTLIAAGTAWRYESSGVFPTNWLDARYRDTGWRQGQAQLGYGDGDEKTVVTLLHNQPLRPVTTYFRKSFDAPANLNSFQLRVLRDDGVRVHLNGAEIFRNNLPGGAGSISNTTLASSSVNGDAESAWLTTNFASHVLGSLLLPARNVLGAEVHQVGLNNADLSFDLQLVGFGNPLPSVALTAPISGTTLSMPSNILLTATATDPFGSITAVEFFRNTQSLGSVASAPYELSWGNPPSGLQILTAVAIDSDNARATSAPVSVVVLRPVALSIAYDATEVELRWPSTASGYVLETTTNLATASWGALPNPVFLSNSHFRVRASLLPHEQFFRLRLP